MTAAHRLHGPLPELEAPVLIVMLTGWIDASGAAAAAVDAVQSSCAVRPIATFDDDVYIDYRARRPTMELRDGVNTRLVWSVPELGVGRDASGQDVLVLSGPEPDAAWRRFADEIGELAVQLGVRQMIGFGAYPIAAPHTRPPRISCTSPSSAIVESVPYLASSLDVPAGMEALLEHAVHERGIPAIGLWAQVPHYVAAMAYPAATVALLEAASRTAGLSLDATTARREALVQRERLDQLVEANPDHREMLAQLEHTYDAEHLAGPDPDDDTALSADDLPSGEELAAELERFLRDRGPED